MRYNNYDVVVGPPILVPPGDRWTCTYSIYELNHGGRRHPAVHQGVASTSHNGREASNAAEAAALWWIDSRAMGTQP